MTDWIVPPGQMGLGPVAGLGIATRDPDGRTRIVDMERGINPRMSLPTHSAHRCAHGLNPQACLQCFHARDRAPKPTPPPRKVVGNLAFAQPPSPVIAAVKARIGPPPSLVPQVSAPVHVGVRPDGTKIEPPAPPQEAPRTRGKMPVPVLHGAMAQAGQGATQTTIPGAMPAAFSYAADQGRTDSKGVWHPPRHAQLIDSLPRHPHAGR